MALFVDRIGERSTLGGRSPFYLIYGYDPILPIETAVPTWRVIDWDTVKDTAALVDARVRMLSRKSLDVEKARHAVLEFRKKLAERTNLERRHTLRRDSLKAGDLVLVYDVVRNKIDKSRTRKLQMRWKGPYRVKHCWNNASYKLETLDGHEFPTSMAADRLKKFVKDASGWWSSIDDDILLRDDDFVELNEAETLGDVVVEIPGLPVAEQTAYRYMAEEDLDITDEVALGREL